MSSGEAATTIREGDRDDNAEFQAVDVAWLYVAHCPDSDKEGTWVRLVGGAAATLLVGRDVQDGVTLQDPRMSRLHFRLVWDIAQRAYRLGDCDSSNGTYINGERVRSQLLRSSDVIRSGDSLLVFDNERRHERLCDRARRIAPSGLSAMLLGETGVGKEVMARLIHEHSGRRGEFVAVNCATLSRELAAAELFGHTRGAFTGATGSRTGLFASADQGTLLLDEIGDLPLDVQPTLLRALQEGKVRAVGSDELKQVQVRVLAATHVDLFEAAERGSFRKDLLARLAQVRLELAPLRERRSEVLPLLRHFAAEVGYQLKLSANAAEALLLWHYPFNVRELQAIAGSIATERTGGRVDLASLRQVDVALTNQGSFHSQSRESGADTDTHMRRLRLKELLKQHGGNVTHVAKALGSNRSQVYRWMKALGLSAENFRE